MGRFRDLPPVGDVRGTGYLWSVELVRGRATKAPFTRQDCERVRRGFVAPAIFEAGV